MNSRSVSPDHPYSPSARAVGLVFASGALSVDDNYDVVTGRRESLDAALANAEWRLQTQGAELSDAVKVTYYVTDVSLRDEANEQFLSMWSEPRPARTFVGVDELPYGATVEIDVIAAP